MTSGTEKMQKLSCLCQFWLSVASETNKTDSKFQLIEHFCFLLELKALKSSQWHQKLTKKSPVLNYSKKIRIFLTFCCFIFVLKGSERHQKAKKDKGNDLRDGKKALKTSKVENIWL